MTRARLCRSLLRLFAVTTLFACVTLVATSAEVVILKDGYMIQGNVRKESTVMTDKATGQSFQIPKDNGYDLIDAGPKTIIFSTHAKQLGELSKDARIRPDYKPYTMKFYGRKNNDPLPQGVLTDPGEFDARWFRRIKVAVPPNSFDFIEEQITHIDPYFTYMVSPTHLWREAFRTSEFEPARVRKLLTTPLFKLNKLGLAALKGANMPEDVLKKVNTLYDRDLSQETLEKELARILTVAEQAQWKDLILKSSLAPQPELAEIKGHPEARKRIALAKFMLDAGWLKSAKEELEQIKTLFPDGVPKESKESFDKLVKDIDTATIERVIKESELALGSGRYNYASELLGVFPEKLATPKQIDDATKLMAQLKATRERYASGRRLLRSLLDEVTGLDQAKGALAVGGGMVIPVWPRRPLPTPMVDLTAAAEQVYLELHPDTSHRIETFVNLATQAEHEKLQGRDPTKKNDALLAIVISGWAMGKNGANPDPVQALKIWGAREAILAYQRTDDLNGRNTILHRFKRDNLVGIDVLAQIISLLPPASPENLLAREGTQVLGKNKLPNGVYKRNMTPTATHPRGIPYYLKLPPEYHHGRTYPVLIVLGSANFDVEGVLDSLAPESDRHGYILVAPDWANKFGNGGWQWDGEDHWYVTAILQEVVRTYCVDNDRVFMMGVGDGGNVAMDVGLSHPDLFAGVVPISPIPKPKLISEYWRNGQALPFFVATGELAGNSYTYLDKYLFKKWMPRGYPAIMTIYKGRGVEGYPAEIPEIFDWMGRKKRITVTGVLGLEGKYREPWATMRRTDNRFYWLGVDEVISKCLIENHKGSFANAATIQGDVLGDNTIRISSQGVTRCSVFLTSDLIDWNKGVKVVINNTPAPGYLRPQMLEPNLDLMLQDYRERGDRRVLVWGRLEFKTVP